MFLKVVLGKVIQKKQRQKPELSFQLTKQAK